MINVYIHTFAFSMTKRAEMDPSWSILKAGTAFTVTVVLSIIMISSSSIPLPFPCDCASLQSLASLQNSCSTYVHM